VEAQRCSFEQAGGFSAIHVLPKGKVFLSTTFPPTSLNHSSFVPLINTSHASLTLDRSHSGI
jgi:hypothetical protein